MIKLTKTESERLAIIKKMGLVTSQELADKLNMKLTVASRVLSTLTKKGILINLGNDYNCKCKPCTFKFNENAEYKNYEAPSAKYYKEYDKPKHFDHVFNKAFRGEANNG